MKTHLFSIRAATLAQGDEEYHLVCLRKGRRECVDSKAIAQVSGNGSEVSANLLGGVGGSLGTPLTG